MLIKRIKKIFISQYVQSINSAEKSIDKDLRAIDDVLIDNFSDDESIPNPSEYGSSVSGRKYIEDDLDTGVYQRWQYDASVVMSTCLLDMLTVPQWWLYVS